MLKQPYFSIATPCWNSATTIEHTIKSVLAQEFKDYEYIIVDGGSTDGTLEIIKRYEPLFEGRMRWKSEKDEGLYDAFNKGVERSTGVYCWNVNADDYIEPDALIKIYRFIQENCPTEKDVISGFMNFLTPEGELIKVVKCEDTKGSPDEWRSGRGREVFLPVLLRVLIGTAMITDQEINDFVFSLSLQIQFSPGITVGFVVGVVASTEIMPFCRGKKALIDLHPALADGLVVGRRSQKVKVSQTGAEEGDTNGVVCGMDATFVCVLSAVQLTDIPNQNTCVQVL